MPPKFQFTKQEITNAALNITRRHGLSGLTARALAAELGCSVKPIFGAFQNMEQVQRAVLDAANELYGSYIRENMAKGEYPPYKASGMAYIRFAKDEKELFKLLFMRDRRREQIQEDREVIRPILDLIRGELGVNETEAWLFHMEMWIFVHGIAAMTATDYLDWDDEFISRALTDMFQGLKRRKLEQRKQQEVENHGSH